MHNLSSDEAGKMILKSKRLILRPAKISDAKILFNYEQDSEAKKNFMTTSKSIAEVIKGIKKKERNSEGFVIEYEGKVVGSIGIHDIIPGHKAISSSLVAKQFRGKGIGTEAHKLFLKYVFKKYKLKRIQGNVRSFNKASARMLEKAGYKFEGRLRKNKLKEGKFMDDLIYAIVK